jgi:hypothetical protein
MIESNEQHPENHRLRMKNFQQTIYKVIAHWFFRIVVFWRKLRTALARIAITVSAFIASLGLLCFPEVRKLIDDFKPLEGILSQLGATFGTIFALVLSLSIIPIQRAGEAWSPSIIRLYRRDRATHLSFVTLGIFCIACFIFAVRGVGGVQVSVALAGAIVALGIGLDLLRWYHDHICELLDPLYAIKLELGHARQAIDKTKVTVSRVSRIHLGGLDPKISENISIEDIETMFYPHIPGYPNSINFWINDLGEIALKAVSRGEKTLARTAIFSIAEATNYYLSARKLNLEIVRSMEVFMATESDVKAVTNPAYEMLYEISRLAISQGDESTAIRVSEAYQSVAIHTSSLGARAYRPGSAPLTGAPIYYLLSCVKFAQNKGSDEVSFQSAALLSEIAKKAPKDIIQTDIHIPVFDAIYDVALYHYTKRNFVLAEEVIGQMFLVLDHMLWEKDRYFHDSLRYVLEKIELLVPFAIINETFADRLSMLHPLEKAYGLVFGASLGHLFQKAAAILPSINAERDWVNPYYDLIKISDIISRHLRNVAENNEFGNSFLVWEIDSTIKHIATIIAQIVDSPLRPKYEDERKLVDKLQWIMAFYWVAFEKKKTINAHRSDDVCNSLAFIGLLFFDRNYSEVLSLTISHIRSILDSYCEIARPPDFYAIGDIMAYLWVIRMGSDVRQNATVTAVIDKKLSEKPPSLSGDQWLAAKEAIFLRRKQVSKRIAEIDAFARHDSAETLAFQLIQQAQKGQ